VTVAPVRLLAAAIGDIGIASSRVRLYNLVELLPDRFEATVLGPVDNADLTAHDPGAFDVVYMQKAAGPQALEFCRRAVDAGTPVVYDIDDDFGCWPGMDESGMCAMASVVTVDSRQRAAAVAPAAAGPVVVLPGMIDAADDPARAAAGRHRERLATVASFGNLVSLRNTRPYLDAVPAEIETYVIGPPEGRAELAGVRLVPFRLDTFVADLAEADVFLLAHGPREAPLKDNNRLVMALSLGVPTLVSPTPAYLDVLSHLDLEWLACAPHEVGSRLARLADPAVRKAVGDAGREYAWAHYTPAACAARFVEVIDLALEGTR
jgi:glycosyltransferase involved in cell wall biosynthesis